jgi:hypothetical protein
MLPIIAAKHLIIASNGSSLSYLHKKKTESLPNKPQEQIASVMCPIQWQQRSGVNAGHGLLIMTGKKTMLSVAFFH